MLRIHQEFPWIHFDEDIHALVCRKCKAEQFLPFDSVGLAKGEELVLEFVDKHKDCEGEPE